MTKERRLEDEVEPELRRLETSERACRQKLQEAMTAREVIFARAGRNSRFKSKRERDTWIASEIKRLEASERDLTLRQNEIKQEADRERALVEQQAQDTTAKRADIEHIEGDMQRIRAQVVAKSKEWDQLFAQKQYVPALT